MHMPISGLHHVTAIAGQAQKNVDFYAGVLGLRLVKKTVNFDDPGTYHLYYGDEVGHPGTLMTFFPSTHAALGQRGGGQATAVAFSIPPSSLSYWVRRVEDAGYDFKHSRARFGDEVLSILDPDGLRIELVAQAAADAWPGWGGGTVPIHHSIRNLHSVSIAVGVLERTAYLLEDVFGLEPVGEDRNRVRFRSRVEDRAARVDLLHHPNGERGVMGRGSVHHVAFRVPDEDAQREMQDELARRGYDVTPVMERQYFKSVYFREENGVLFEIATDTPGFAIDERVEELGTHLMLPSWLHEHRDNIERILPKLEVPAVRQANVE